MHGFLCKLFGHHRHARRARPSIDGWRAPCRLCGERMVRIAPKQWRLLREVGSITPAASPGVARNQPFASIREEIEQEREAPSLAAPAPRS